jgi:hypothetical protein
MDDKMPYSLEPMPTEDGAKLTAELQEVLKKYDAEMGVKSTIEIYRRVYPSPLTAEDVKNGEPTN